jgi:hypothetical protein
MCHNGQTIEVNESAVQAHLDHGDTLGPCPETVIQEPVVEPDILQDWLVVEPEIVVEPEVVIEPEIIEPEIVIE